jgi:Ca2+-binding EF-hand superfamily protein
MTYDSEGRFRPQNFEDFFSKYDKDGKGGLSKQDLVTALRGQAFAFDFFGCTATVLECKFHIRSAD